MIRVTLHNNGTRSYQRNGNPMSPQQVAADTRRRNQLHGGMAEICRSRRAPTPDTDTAHLAINRSGMSEHEKAYVARKAKQMGLNEDCAYDATVPYQQVYESRSQVDAAIQAERDAADREEGKSLHRLHPQLVQELRQAKLKQDPSLAKRDRRELDEQIIETHGLPEYYQ